MQRVKTVLLLGSDICAETENVLRQRDDVAHLRTIYFALYKCTHYYYYYYYYCHSFFFSSIRSMPIMRLQQVASNSTCSTVSVMFNYQRMIICPWCCLTMFMVALLYFCFSWHDSTLLLVVAFFFPLFVTCSNCLFQSTCSARNAICITACGSKANR